MLRAKGMAYAMGTIVAQPTQATSIGQMLHFGIVLQQAVMANMLGEHQPPFWCRSQAGAIFG